MTTTNTLSLSPIESGFLDLLIAKAERLTGATCWVAGGAIRDFLLGKDPKDIDLFVLNYGGMTSDAMIGFGQLADDFTPVNNDSDMMYRENLKVSLTYRGMKVQVCDYPDTPNVETLLAGFDWNICLFAYHPSRGVVAQMDPAKIVPGGKLELHDLHIPYLATIRRGFRFAERYHMHMSDATIRRMFEAWLAESSTH